MTADRPATEPKCDAVLAYCVLPMGHAGTHEYPHAAMKSHLAETADCAVHPPCGSCEARMHYPSDEGSDTARICKRFRHDEHCIDEPHA